MTSTTTAPRWHRAFLALALALAAAGPALAIQPPDSGARPVHARLAAIDRENEALTLRLRSGKTTAQEKADLRTRQAALAAEKQGLQKELIRLEEQKNSPTVQFIGPGEAAQ